MAHDVRVIPAREFLRADVHGNLDLRQSKELLKELAAATTGFPDRHILIDVRDVPATGPRLSSEELFEIVQTLHSLGLGVLNRIAIVRRPPEAFDRARFLEMLAGERGIQISAFESFEEAFNWLYGSETPIPTAEEGARRG
jgi:hypothetical protein